MRDILLLGILGGVIPTVVAGTTPTSRASAPTFRDTVVVTASLDEEEVSDLPSSVSVVEAEEIEARQATTVREILATQAGIHSAQSGSPGQQASVFVRGAESDQVLVVWNGVPLNNPFFGDFNWAFLPTDGVERVEVAKGPYSALYGGSAAAGVVQVLTRPNPGTRLRLEAGGDGYRRGSLAAAFGPERLRVHLAGHLRRGDGAFANDYYDGGEISGRFAGQLLPGLEAGLLLRLNDSDTGIPFASGLPSPDRRIAWQELQMAVPVRLERRDWSLEANLSHVSYDSVFRDPQAFLGPTDTDSFADRGRLVASYDISARGWIAAGSEIERLRVTYRSPFGDLDNVDQRTRALFGELHWELPRVALQLGLRRDDNQVYGGETSPKLGLAVQLTPKLRLRGNWAEGFRAPSLGELFFPGSGNPDLEPETSESIELGIDFWAGKWRLGLVAFDNRQSNLIEFDLTSFANINLGRARSRGLEAVASVRSLRASARVDATYLDAEETDSGLPLLRRPRRSADLVLTFWPGAWTVNLVASYVGQRPDFDPITFQRATNPSYARFDLAAEHRLRPWLAPYARIENAADEEYEQALGFASPGRTFVAGVALRF